MIDNDVAGRLINRQPSQFGGVCLLYFPTTMPKRGSTAPVCDADWITEPGPLLDVLDQETGAFAGAYNECTGYALIVGLMQDCFDSSVQIMGVQRMLLRGN